jgi:TonB family protein
MLVRLLQCGPGTPHGLNERKLPVLASDEEGVTLDTLRFSLASDIVELVVLTIDEAFLQTLREAVGGARRLWHVLSANKVSDLLMAGEVGILVLDVETLNEAPAVFIGQIKRQFPDLVVVVAGNRDAETSLAGLISAGTVYRFIHKPMSPARAKLFADAAVKKYVERRRRVAAAPAVRPRSQSPRGALLAGAIGVLVLIVVAAWIMHRRSDDGAGPARATDVARTTSAESPFLTQAAAALAANRLTEPPGDNALELYLKEQARNPDGQQARAGLVEVRERLLARAENAMLEERLDEASAAIDTARRSGAEIGRVVFLTSQLAKLRERVKTAQAAVRLHNQAKVDADKVTPLLALAAQRTAEAHLIDPPRDNAVFYTKEALRIDPNSDAARQAQDGLTIRLLSEARGAIDRRDFARASAWLDAAKGTTAPATLSAAHALLASARQQADADARAQLLKNAAERLQQDRLIEPADDSAKYYLLTLRSLDPGHAGLASATQGLGIRLVAKARLALDLRQFDAARNWLDEAAAVGFASPESMSVQHDLDTALAAEKFLANVVAASDLTLVKSVQPVYPRKAESSKVEGWVELDFTVAESGAVKDIAVHSANPAGVFENAAISALSQWRYKPILHDAKPEAKRARIRIRFVLPEVSVGRLGR